MPPKFHAHRDKAIRKVDEIMGETLRHYPMINGMADAARVKTEFTAVVRSGQAEEKNVSGTSASWGSRITSGKTEVHISRLAYPDLLVKDGDRIVALDRPGEHRFQVAGINDRMHGRIILEVTEL
ncbi:hypothetical protein [Roseovarius confluentis]|uniref:hypothetical protein n=1 Tax=Roseovarius confluentis TaxID=1852027 RepID=UPI003BA9650E